LVHALSGAKLAPVGGYQGSSSATATTLLGVAAAAAAGSMKQVPRQDLRRLLLRARPVLVVALLVLQKCATDGLTWYTRTRGSVPYSGSSAALLSEMLKFPVMAVAIAVSESPGRVLPTFQNATRNIWVLAWVAAAYAAQNLLYFLCLDHISPAGYQVLGQTKLVFTACLMRVMLGTRFSPARLLALALLIGGAVAAQSGEASSAAAIGEKGNVLFGCGLTVLSSLLSSLPNVVYERALKSQQEEWTLNLQLTFWILFWLLAIRAYGHSEDVGVMEGGGLAGLTNSIAELTVGFTPAVWAMVFLKALNCLIIPACLKYADNIVYGYAKPASIVLTCATTSVVTSSLPEPSLVVGFAMVVSSMWLYGRG